MLTDTWDALRRNFRLLSMSTRRKRTSWLANHSPALFLPPAKPGQNASDRFALLCRSEDHIVEHAARRADFIFYCMIGCYQTQWVPEIGRTGLQHGVGKKPVTEACHSSLFPTLYRNKIFTQKLFNPHFNHVLNATMELPPLVNQLDHQIEIRLKGRALMLEVLRIVSRGEMTPIQGMEKFFIMMEQCFETLEAEAMHFKDETEKEARQYLVGLMREGTFLYHWCSESRRLRKEYVCMILRMDCVEVLEEKVLLQKMMEIQKELHEEDENSSIKLCHSREGGNPR